MATGVRRISFTGSEGVEVAALLDLPDATPKSFALFAHCFTCSKDLHVTKRISGALAGYNIATLRVDFTGLGESEGDFAATTFSSNINDLVAAADYLRDEYQAPSLLIGHSLGGAAVIAASRSISSARAIATIGAPSDPAHIKRLVADSKQEIEQHGEAEVFIGGRPFTIRQQFLDDLAQHSLTDTLAELKKPVLVMHAPGDAIVSVEHARALFEAAFHPKSFLSLDDADHLLSKPRDAKYAALMIAAWAGRYLTDD